MPSVFVTGHTGMLGHVVTRVFKDAGWTVATSDQRFRGDPSTGLVQEVRNSGCDAVVNCVGSKDLADIHSLMFANAVLPQLLAAAQPEVLLIHASSDGVFSGQHGPYAVDDPPDAQDEYGLSKRLGELSIHSRRTIIFRCSIIGINIGEARGLLSWFLSQKSPVTGYTDHTWNGITTLSWAKLALQAANGGMAMGIHQPAASEPLTKAGLLNTMAKVYGRGPKIKAAPSGHPVNRTLVPTLRLAPIEEQLRDLKEWYQ